MEAFFSRFPGFVYNPKHQEEFEFNRLRDIQGWVPYTLLYKDAYREFLQAYFEETGAAMDKFFITEYPNFDYKTRASPMAEFQRLKQYKEWNEYSDEYKRARRLFETAYDDQFNRDVDGFFNWYPEFEYNPRGEAKSEFERMRKFKGWVERPGERPNSYAVQQRKSEYRKARTLFFRAFVSDFTYFFGHGDKLQNWVFLCDLLRVNPTPRNIEDCKTALRPFYINIYNLLDHVQQKVRLIRHSSLEALADYTMAEKKIFPLELAEGTCMEFLLRRINLSGGRPGYRFDDWSGTFKPIDDCYQW